MDSVCPAVSAYRLGLEAGAEAAEGAELTIEILGVSAPRR